mmetsp:Transcript_72726/g.229090  ORF Transcript_72726/g.229090 Transcript_72726/m.229090 type:complete len:394 (+) Transcript_72726:141-1322(+)
MPIGSLFWGVVVLLQACLLAGQAGQRAPKASAPAGEHAAYARARRFGGVKKPRWAEAVATAHARPPKPNPMAGRFRQARRNMQLPSFDAPADLPPTSYPPARAFLRRCRESMREMRREVAEHGYNPAAERRVGGPEIAPSEVLALAAAAEAAELDALVVAGAQSVAAEAIARVFSRRGRAIDLRALGLQTKEARSELEGVTEVEANPGNIFRIAREAVMSFPGKRVGALVEGPARGDGVSMCHMLTEEFEEVVFCAVLGSARWVLGPPRGEDTWRETEGKFAKQGAHFEALRTLPRLIMSTDEPWFRALYADMDRAAAVENLRAAYDEKLLPEGFGLALLAGRSLAPGRPQCKVPGKSSAGWVEVGGVLHVKCSACFPGSAAKRCTAPARHRP